MTRALDIVRTGPLALIEDLGRPGLAHLGVSRSGAADRRAHTLANRLVANPDSAATVEVTFGGFTARAIGGDLDIAVTGAETNPTVDGVPFGTNSVYRLRVGHTLALGAPVAGVRSYLAVRGGIATDPELGSRSFDVLSHLGPRPLQAGDVLAVGTPRPDYPELDQAPVAPIGTKPAEIHLRPGPRADWLQDPNALVQATWTVSDRSDRVGTRLTGLPLHHRFPDRQLPSEGATRGAIQVPPNGFPVILGPDHPVTGGYPVAAVVIDADLDALAQIRPGQLVRLRWWPGHSGAGSPRTW